MANAGKTVQVVVAGAVQPMGSSIFGVKARQSGLTWASLSCLM
jgi:hypothetical protein